MDHNDITGFSWEIALDGKHYKPIVALRGAAFEMAHFNVSKLKFISDLIKQVMTYNATCKNSRLILFMDEVAVEVTQIYFRKKESNLVRKKTEPKDLDIQKKLYDTLTPREKEVLNLIDQEMSRSKIA